MSSLRLRSWTVLFCYRPNCEQCVLLLFLQIRCQISLDRTCPIQCIRQWPEWPDLKRAFNHSNALSVLEDYTQDLHWTSVQPWRQGLNPFGTSPIHIHTVAFNVCIRSNFNSHTILNYLRTTYFASYVGFDTKLFLDYPTQVIDRFGFYFPFEIPRGWL